MPAGRPKANRDEDKTYIVIYKADLPKFTGLHGETNPEKMRGLLIRDRTQGAKFKVIEIDYFHEKAKNHRASMRDSNKSDGVNWHAEDAIAALNAIIANYNMLLNARIVTEKEREECTKMIAHYQEQIRVVRQTADELIQELQAKAKAKEAMSRLDDLEVSR